MYKVMKLLKGKQSGQALVLALALLGVGSLMIAPMLSFMGTGLNAGVVSEDKMDELYACDAGVQDAIWQVNHLDEPGAIPYSYLDGVDNDTGLPIIPPYEVYDYIDPVIGRTLPNVNGMDVGVRITLIYLVKGFGTYQVQTWVPVQPGVSFGVNWGDASTKIDAIITTTWLDYSDFLNHIITTGGTIEDPPPPIPPGNPPVYDPSDPYPVHENGYIENHPDNQWPTVEEIKNYYMQYVDPVNDLYSDPDFNIRDLSVPRIVGPIYWDHGGGDIDFKDTGGGSDITASLGGTVYVAGETSNLRIVTGKTTLDLASDAMFCEGTINFGPQSIITGSGCIVAVGDIWFSPHIDGNTDDFIFVMSLTGTVHFSPQDDFYGAVAGNVLVETWPGVDITYTDPPDELNWPGGGGVLIWGVQTWLYNENYVNPL